MPAVDILRECRKNGPTDSSPKDLDNVPAVTHIRRMRHIQARLTKAWVLFK